jgi:hypothetical protein
MFISQLLRVRFIAAIALALVLATAAYGFAATNTVQNSGAGDGNAVISGYHVSDVVYALNESDPSKIDSMSFNVAPARCERLSRVLALKTASSPISDEDFGPLASRSGT